MTSSEENIRKRLNARREELMQLADITAADGIAGGAGPAIGRQVEPHGRDAAPGDEPGTGAKARA